MIIRLDIMRYNEIHRYDNGRFHYVVARTTKYSEAKVREDVNKMNHMLTDVVKSQGTWYEYMSASPAEETGQLRHK